MCLVLCYYANSNKLKAVTDQVADTDYSEGLNGVDDIDNQINSNNYTYDAIGNLKTDDAENITDIQWTVYGKIKSITRNGNTIEYYYDPAGNRIGKRNGTNLTLYIRDASGNVMSVYESVSNAAPVQK